LIGDFGRGSKKHLWDCQGIKRKIFTTKDEGGRRGRVHQEIGGHCFGTNE